MPEDMDPGSRRWRGSPGMTAEFGARQTHLLPSRGGGPSGTRGATFRNGTVGHEPAQRGEPFGKPFGLEVPHPFVALVGGAVERCPPLDERPVVGNDRNDTDRRGVVAHREWRRAAEGVAVGAIDVGMSQQNLAHGVAAAGDAAHRPDLVSRLAVFDDGFALDAGPGIVTERADHRPHVFGRMFEDDAVIGLCHRSNLRSVLCPCSTRLRIPPRAAATRFLCPNRWAPAQAEPALSSRPSAARAGIQIPLSRLYFSSRGTWIPGLAAGAARPG